MTPLEPEVPVRRDLWPSIERRARRSDRGRALLLRGGALTFLLVLAAIPAGLALRASGEPATPLDRARAEYDHARRGLLRALQDQEHSIDAAALELVRRDLEAVDRDLSELDGAERTEELAARYERDARILAETARLLSRPAAYWGE